MKKIFNSFLIVAVMASVATISSCTKTCDLGYEGDNCKTEVRAKYLGNFNGSEACTSGTTPVSVNGVTVSGDVVKVTFTNLYGAGFNTTGTVQADGSITIANQSFGTGQISGSATINAGKIVITYTVTSGGASDACTWTQS